MPDPVGLLLAAGQSRRFGGDKLLHPLPDGEPVAVWAAKNLCVALKRVVAIVGTEGALSAALRAAGCEVALFPGARKGMGASIAFGVGLTDNPVGWHIALADMPYIRPETHAAVAAALRAGAPLAAPRFQHRRGHPVAFGARFAGELCRLEGDAGAKAILDRHRHWLHQLDCPDAGILLDIDTREDLSSAAGLSW